MVACVTDPVDFDKLHIFNHYTAAAYEASPAIHSVIFVALCHTASLHAAQSLQGMYRAISFQICPLNFFKGVRLEGRNPTM